ncbi:hypothetical protein MCEMSEM18_00219 [Comamonadaceae bacterium]
MNLQELLRAKRTVYVLAEKPGLDHASAKQYWYLQLAGLHQEQIRTSVDRLRQQKLKAALTKSEKRTLKSKSLQDSMARTLGAQSYDDWLEIEQPKIERLLKEHGMYEPSDLIKWAYSPGFSGPLKARQISDRLFNSGLAKPQRIFTGVGSYLFAPRGYGSLDIDGIAGDYAEDEERFEFCRERSNDVLLIAEQMKDSAAPERIEMTGRSLMLNAVSEDVGCMFNMLGDNLVMPRVTPPEFTLYRATEKVKDFQLKIFELFREEIERSDDGWVDVIPVPGNENLIFLKGQNGAFDWVVRDQRDIELTSNPLHPFFKKSEVPTAMDTSQIAASYYFTPGHWQERLEHDAEERHYADGGEAANWPGYDKLIERKFLSNPSFKLPKRKAGRASDHFVSHRVDNYRLMVSPLISIDQFASFLAETGWARTRLEKAHEVGLDIERDLLSVNTGDSGELPVSVTWLDAVAYCRDYEKRHELPVRLLEPEEWTQIAPAPTVDRSRVARERRIHCKSGEMPIDPIYAQLDWAVVGGDGQLGENSKDSYMPDGTLSFVQNLRWSHNGEGLPFLSMAGFCEWLSGYQGGFAPFAEAGRGILATGAGMFGDLKPAHLAMRDQGAKVGFRLCYIAHPDA